MRIPKAETMAKWAIVALSAVAAANRIPAVSKFINNKK